MGNKPAGCNSQQPLQALLEDAISALRERPGSTQSDIIKYLESKYDRSIPTKTKEKLLDRLKPILKASKVEYNRGNNRRGANRGGGRAAQGLGKRKGGGTAAAANTGRRACRSTTSQTNHRGNKSRCKSRASSSRPKKLNGSRSMKRKVGGSTCIKRGRISSSNNARRRNKMEPRSRIIKSNHGRTGPQSGTKFALNKYQTQAPRYNNYTYNNAYKKKIGRRGRQPTGHFSKMDSSSIYPCIDISGNHHENN